MDQATGEIIANNEPSALLVASGWLRETILVPGLMGLFVMIAGHFALQWAVETIKRRIYNPDQHMDELPYQKKMADLIGSIVSVIGYAFIIMITMQVIGFNMTLLMGGIAFGIGFAMENTFSNLVAALLLVTNPKISLGSTYRFRGSINQTAKRESINPKYCILRLLDKTKMLIPNRIILKTPVSYISQDPIVRGDIAIDIALNADVARAMTVMREVINSFPEFTNKEQTYASIGKITPNGITIVGRYYRAPKGSKTPILKLMAKLKHHILLSFQKNMIDIAYPSTVLMHKG